ncbi:MAG: PEP-CTERM sorting domain-containing protein [Bryobacteraceae bacterium]
MKLTTLPVCLLAGATLMAPAFLRAGAVNVIVVVDESGSMAGEHAWLPGMISSMDTQLTGMGHTASFGLYGFGGGGGGNLGRELLDNGSATDFATAAAGLTIGGGFEDGYSGLDFAFNNFSFTPGAAVNYILVTDEDRDNGNATLSVSGIQTMLAGQNALLNAVVDNAFSCDAGGALGLAPGSTGYVADGAGGFSTCGNGAAGSGFGTTEADYVSLALASGGAGWDLNQLRAGGATATSFTAAFVDLKVQEISRQIDAPEPGAFLLMAIGLLAIGFRRRMTA